MSHMNTNPVQREAVMRRLTDVASIVSADIPNINRGGCGVLAVALCDELHAQGFTDAKIRAYNYDFAPQPNLCALEQELADPENIREWMDNGASFCHIVVEFNGKMWDSSGGTPVEKAEKWNRIYVLSDGHVSLDAMRRMADKRDGWSPFFDRDQIPAVRKIVKYMLAP